jgi:predicted ATPase/signal transduction histidine kinase/tRNA A-37 threonylcarbamoyl transferase component Bud32
MSLNTSENLHLHLDIPGYQIVEQLYFGSRTIVYRAIQTSQQRPVVIKVLRKEYPSFSELVQFRNQYTITKNLPISGIIQPLSLELLGNSYMLVMEDWGGISLGEYLKQEKNLPWLEALEIAVQLSNILHQLAHYRVVHKDIKPANILINPESRQIKLIDFSIATLLPKEIQESQSINTLEGTLAYLAPEQTGRMNRGIDYRTDFYGLGVTLYQLLTGTLPFNSQDPLELVHCHIAKIAKSVEKINTKVPERVSAIVAKLMAKNAEDRYQSAMGLKHDLEYCLTEWKERGEIAAFELGQRDLSDRFNIPEKLYGREHEVKTLLKSFERVADGASELMLVAGFSGIGKTAVVNEVHKPITRQQGYFIRGKFDQFNRNIPLSAFVEALRDLMQQLLTESDTKLESWKNKILAAVELNGQILIEVIPELEQIIGKQPEVTELSGSAAQNRFNLLFPKFIEVFSTRAHPLVMFLDDLQWADSASLQLIKLLMNNNGYLLMLGAYRDNEVSPAHPFILTVDELKKAGATVNTITLSPLEFTDANRLIADTLNCGSELTKPLTQLVMQKTQGNPFFLTQFLKVLHEGKLIIFNHEQRYWEYNIAEATASSLTSDVVEFMAEQLQKLPHETQQVLKLAACVGYQFDLNTLAIVSEQSPSNTAGVLWKTLQEGFVLPTKQIYKLFQTKATSKETSETANPHYRFLHDRVQQAAYSLIPEKQKQATHLQIGRLLQQKLSREEQDEKLFDLVGHLNLGQVLITQQSEREALARLNLAASKKAKNSTAYVGAKNFVQAGLKLLAKNSWESQYELTLNLYLAAAETFYLNADFKGMEEIAVQVLGSAQTVLDKVKIYEIQINALTAQSRMLEAIAVGRHALSQLGIEFSSEPDEALVSKALKTITEQLQSQKIEELINLPTMNNPQIVAGIQILAILFPPIFQGNPAMLPLLGSTMVSLSLQFGNAPASTIGYVCYGTVLSGFMGEVETGYRFGRLALSLVEKLDVRELKPLTILWFSATLQHRQELLRATIPILKDGYLTGMEIGDFLDAGYSIARYFDDNFFAGVNLDEWEPEIENYCAVLASVKQESPQTYLKMKQQMVRNWREIAVQPDLLIGTAYNETLMIPKHEQDNELTALAVIYIFKLILAYVFGNFSNAIEYIYKANFSLMALAGTFQIPVFHFYAGLTYLAIFPTQSDIEQANTFTLLETHKTALTQWANYAPMNHQHKVDLLEAENCRILGKNYEAGDWYDRAIAGAKKNGYIQEEALANELAAKFYLNWGKEKVAAGYIQEAYYCYARWGAKAKTDDLERRHPNLLRPILQQANQSFNSLETFGSLASEHLSIQTSTSISSSSKTSVNTMLDFATILKASQTLSSEIEFDKLLATLLEMVLENAGADKGVLLMPRQKDLFVEAIAILNQPVQVETIAISNRTDLPHSLINTVKRNLKPVVITDARNHPYFVNDNFIVEQQAKSVLCIPIQHQGKLAAILYLENQVTTKAFTGDRVELLNVLCTQAAISLENARLYKDGQDKLEHLQEANRLLAFQSTVSHIAAKNDNLSTMLQQFCQAIVDYLSAAFARIWVSNSANDILELKASAGMYTHINGGHQYIPIGKFKIGLIAQEKAPHLTNDVLNDPRVGDHEWAKQEGMVAFAGYPLMIENRLIGVVAMFARTPLSGSTLSSLEVVATEISLGIQRKFLESSVEQKALILEQTLQELQNAQLQTVQSEKMASLGNLVAGVAHEINNPVGFLTGSINNAKDYVQDLLEHIELYQKQYPTPTAPIQSSANKIDLEYLCEDLPQLLNAMQGATDRIKNISTSLRTFSRADTEYKVSANLHEGIDSTLLILKYRLKGSEFRPEIDIIREYGELPTITCFPGQLNQVFMNILANAIDMFDEVAQTQSYEKIKANPQKITISTQRIGEEVLISIRDNGKGIDESTQARIFDHLFTTKAVGKGTGLGLAIAKQIVEEKHSGRLEVNSAVGQGTEFAIFMPIRELSII